MIGPPVTLLSRPQTPSRSMQEESSRVTNRQHYWEWIPPKYTDKRLGTSGCRRANLRRGSDAGAFDLELPPVQRGNEESDFPVTPAFLNLSCVVQVALAVALYSNRVVTIRKQQIAEDITVEKTCHKSYHVSNFPFPLVTLPQLDPSNPLPTCLVS